MVLGDFLVNLRDCRGALVNNAPIAILARAMVDLFKARWNRFRRRPICSAPCLPFGTWLQLREEGAGDCRVGCSACEAAQTGTPWANFTITDFNAWALQKVDRHANSRLHRLALAKTADVPSADMFNDVLNDLRGKGGSKNQMLKWCLDEGLRHVQWLMLRKAHTIALSQDARNHRLLLRLTMSSENFERSSFVVGQLPCLGTNSHQVAETTNLLIQNFAKPMANVPKYGILRLLPAADVSPCQSVLDILHSKTEALVTDAASDEMKSGRLLSGKEKSQFAASLFRNLIFHSPYLICL